MRRRDVTLLMLLATQLGPAQAQAPTAQAPTEVAGVQYPPHVSLGGSPLLLNGAGLRSRFFVKVYTAALYLSDKAGTMEAALAMPGPKRIHVAMLREIDANELGRLFTRGMQDNAPREAFSKSITGTLRLAELFAARKRLKAGEQFTLDYVPGVGTTVFVNGEKQGDPIPEPEFFNALMRIWIGPKPADAGLKAALLGQTATNADGAAPQQ